MTEPTNLISEDAAVAEQQVDEAQGSRRHLLRLAAAAVAGGAAAGLLTSEEAAALPGIMMYADTNNAGPDATILNSSADVAFSVDNSNFDGTGILVTVPKRGYALIASVSSPEANCAAVRAAVDGVNGYAVEASGGEAQLFLHRYLGLDFPTKPSPSGGQFIANLTGLFYCVQNGAGTADENWWTLASRDSAGAFHPISPARVYDSRSSTPLATGVSRTVSVADQISPPITNVVAVGARAIAYNLTVTATVGGFGFLTVNEGGSTATPTSAINWTATAQTLANASVVKLNTNREITVVCGGPGASTHFIIDVVGFYH